MAPLKYSKVQYSTVIPEGEYSDGLSKVQYSKVQYSTVIPEGE